MTIVIIPHQNTPQNKKSAIVGIGLYALRRGEWAMLAAMTLLSQQRGCHRV
jgi:hypothetical protein